MKRHPETSVTRPLKIMSDVVESVFFSAIILGVSIHEIANCGYYLLSKLVVDPAQVKNSIFLVSCFSLTMSFIQFVSQTAILHYKARGSTDPFEVQNQWFQGAILSINIGYSL